MKLPAFAIANTVSRIAYLHICPQISIDSCWLTLRFIRTASKRTSSDQTLMPYAYSGFRFYIEHVYIWYTYTYMWWISCSSIGSLSCSTRIKLKMMLLPSSSWCAHWGSHCQTPCLTCQTRYATHVRVQCEVYTAWNVMMEWCYDWSALLAWGYIILYRVNIHWAKYPSQNNAVHHDIKNCPSWPHW
jgi:hypothetical protein